MDEMMYNSLSSYYNALEKKGYMSFEDSKKLLVLLFYMDFIYHDYDALISREDYQLIERALNCLYGSSCLIPYPEYLEMARMQLGEISELVQRINNMENAVVLKTMDVVPEDGSDIIITREQED